MCLPSLKNTVCRDPRTIRSEFRCWTVLLDRSVRGSLTVCITTVSLHIASNLSILNSKPQIFEFSIFRMSNWNSSDLEAEDYDPNKDYSVQVQRKDGGLASTQVEYHEISTFSIVL